MNVQNPPVTSFDVLWTFFYRGRTGLGGARGIWPLASASHTDDAAGVRDLQKPRFKRKDTSLPPRGPTPKQAFRGPDDALDPGCPATTPRLRLVRLEIKDLRTSRTTHSPEAEMTGATRKE